MFEAFLKRFPDGVYAGIAKARIEELRSKTAAENTRRQEDEKRRQAAEQERRAAAERAKQDQQERAKQYQEMLRHAESRGLLSLHYLLSAQQHRVSKVQEDVLRFYLPSASGLPLLRCRQFRLQIFQEYI